MRGRRGRGGGRIPDPDDPARRSAPPPLGEAVRAFVRERGWDRRLEGARVHEVWEEIAGADLAQHVRPVRLHGGVLVVRADSPAWATEVRFLAAELIRRSNEVLGEGEVRSVTVVAGRPTP